jgi:hypothetical protein
MFIVPEANPSWFNVFSLSLSKLLTAHTIVSFRINCKVCPYLKLQLVPLGIWLTPVNHSLRVAAKSILNCVYHLERILVGL